MGAANPCNIFNIPAGNNTTITGWTVIEGNIDWVSSLPCSWNASDGLLSLDLVGNQTKGGIQQTFDTVPGVSYRVTFDLAGNFGVPPVVKPLTVTVAGTTHNFMFDTTGATLEDMNWTTKSIGFIATSTSTTLAFVSDTTGLGGSGNAGAALDNVRLGPGTAAPAIGLPAFILTALSLLLFGRGRLRRRANRLAC
jgi:choice-of-anchor C domain-containing protein